MRECERCKSNNIKMVVSLVFEMPVKYDRHITKKVLAKKEAELLAANWDRVIYHCQDCGKKFKWEDDINET